MTIKRLGQGLRGPYASPLKPHVLERLQNTWGYLVGPLIAQKTFPIELRGSKLVVGCSDLVALPALQASSMKSWPQLRDRLKTHTGVQITSLVIIPSDPPSPRTIKTQEEDIFKTALDLLRKRAKSSKR